MNDFPSSFIKQSNAMAAVDSAVNVPGESVLGCIALPGDYRCSVHAVAAAADVGAQANQAQEPERSSLASGSRPSRKPTGIAKTRKPDRWWLRKTADVAARHFYFHSVPVLAEPCLPETAALNVEKLHGISRESTPIEKGHRGGMDILASVQTESPYSSQATGSLTLSGARHFLLRPNPPCGEDQRTRLPHKLPAGKLCYD